MKELLSLEKEFSILSQDTHSEMVLLHRKLRDGDINFGLWCSFFANCPIDKVPDCEDCEAYGACTKKESMGPIECFSRREYPY